jgi:Sulfatase-modifying factor enzyme 1
VNRTQFFKANLVSIVLVMGCNRLPEVSDKDSGAPTPTTGVTSGPSSTATATATAPNGSPDAGPTPSSDASNTPLPGSDSAVEGDSGGPSGTATQTPTQSPTAGDAGGSPSPSTAPSASSPVDGGPSYTEWPFDATEAQRRQEETAEALGLDVEISIDLGGGEEMSFILIPPGKTVMGSPSTVPGFEGDETLRDATLTKAFYIGKYQTTRGQFFALLGRDTIYGDSPDQPAVTKYLEARDDLQAAFRAVVPSGWTARFPTEDEYEHAARAGTATIWYTGDLEEDLALIGWYNGNSENTLQDVGQLLPNAWGLFDMVGNAWHWVWAPGSGSYQDMDANNRHLVRGGNYQESPFGNGCRTANRQIRTETDQGGGSRFVLELP